MKFFKVPYRWRCARQNSRKMCDSAWKCATVSRRYRNYSKYVAFDAKFAIVCRFWTVLISQRNCFAFGQKGRSFYWQFNLNSPCSVEIPPYINVHIGVFKNVLLVNLAFWIPCNESSHCKYCIFLFFPACFLLKLSSFIEDFWNKVFSHPKCISIWSPPKGYGRWKAEV